MAMEEFVIITCVLDLQKKSHIAGTVTGTKKLSAGSAAVSSSAHTAILNINRMLREWGYMLPLCPLNGLTVEPDSCARIRDGWDVHCVRKQRSVVIYGMPSRFLLTLSLGLLKSLSKAANLSTLN